MSDQSNVKKSFRREAEGTARDERNIQAGIDSGFDHTGRQTLGACVPIRIPVSDHVH